jgi:hypothetical protein
MIFIAAALAALIAGLSWLIKDVPGILSSGRTGAIRSKSFGSPLIQRDSDPERFDRLVAYRKKQLVWPILMTVLGGLFTVLLITSSVRSVKIPSEPYVRPGSETLTPTLPAPTSTPP